MQNISVIQKESIKGLNFHKTDVLETPSLRHLRYHSLHRALILGNLYHNKVKIVFQTSDNGLQQVETTIWSVSDDFIFLKGGVFVPIKAIVHLEI